MFPFWDLVIAPIFDATEARRIVEIGALRGENTRQMLKRLGPEAELHVIDPVPAFDPAEHEAEFPGRYIFHRDLSVNVLEDLPPMDVALIDGDHNWYTVYHELHMLAAVARKAGAPMPVMILHDVGWPYGRRDLYYAPDTIPEEFRQPYEQKGMGLRQEKLLDKGGLNPTMYNAITSGGARNGVMTAVDDFIDEYDKPLRHLYLPIYFGLSVLVEEEHLQAQPALAGLLDHLEDADGRADLMELAESTRLQAMLTQHGVYFQREQQLERAAKRYLNLLKSALLNEHYLEHELRIRHLATCVEMGRPPVPQKLSDPARGSRQQWQELRQARKAGTHGQPDATDVPAFFPATTMGRARLDDLHECLDVVRKESVRGDVVEAGTGRGGGAVFMRAHLHAWERLAPKVWVADRFRASPETPTETDSTLPGGGEGFPDLQPDLNVVRDVFDRYGLLNQRVRFLQGPYADTLPHAEIEKVALLRVGPGVGAEVGDVLDALYDKVSIGGFVVVDDNLDEASRAAIEAFRDRRGITDPVERVDWSALRWRKTTQAPVESAADRAPVADRPRQSAPLAVKAPGKAKDLTVVVVFHNMKREAQRTLHSLTRAYQRGIDDLDYEVIAVENGSSDDQHLGEELVTSFGPEFRYVDMGTDAPKTPVPALNMGVAHGAGKAFALMIDGAHVLTPGVLRYGLAGLRTYDPAIVLTQQWYVGPGQQPTATANGYDQAFEDRLFDKIAWPQDGYGLFDIGHFISDRDWFDGMWESNCLFVPRKQLQQVGAFDESFTTPGGGYANLDLYERLGSSPDVNVTTILGEGSFHQVHGGTTTNQNVADDRNQGLVEFAGSYSQLRGRSFMGPGRTIHYVGQMTPQALRTKGRRRVATEFWTTRGNNDPGIPETPSPIPDELKLQYAEAVWENLAWRKASWMGTPTDKLPNDLFVYQEILHRVRPDWIIEIGPGPGGRGLFLASMLDLLGNGKVLSLGAGPDDELPTHDRIVRVPGGALNAGTLTKVRELVGDEPHGLVILGARQSVSRTVREFDHYSPFVAVGSYLVIEDTVVNGHPVWPTFGPGPMEAAKQIINRRGEFGPDADLEKFGLTFNPNGFLKRLG